MPWSRGENPTYAAIHLRLRKKIGPASGFWCYDCGEKAEDWAYQYSGNPEYVCPKRDLRFSDDMGDYKPMCYPCHRSLDRKHTTSDKMRPVGQRLASWTREKRQNDRAFDTLIRETCRENGKKAAAIRRTCSVCGLESTAAGMGTHQKFTGHQGVVQPFSP